VRGSLEESRAIVPPPTRAEEAGRMRDHELYATILGLTAPWTVERVDVDGAATSNHRRHPPQGLEARHPPQHH